MRTYLMTMKHPGSSEEFVGIFPDNSGHCVAAQRIVEKMDLGEVVHFTCREVDGSGMYGTIQKFVGQWYMDVKKAKKNVLRWVEETPVAVKEISL